jgi:hypothetical protein
MLATLEDATAPVEYTPTFREFAVVCSPPETQYTFRWCPWCGEELPKSLREEFYEEIWALGLDDDDDPLPAKYRSDAWWRQQPDLSG